MKKFYCLSIVILIFALIGCSNSQIAVSNLPLSTVTPTAAPKPSPTPIPKTDKNIFMLEHIRWNMAVAELKDNENRSVDLDTTNKKGESVTYLSYKPDSTDLYSTNFEYVYLFADSKLKAYWFSYKSDDSCYDMYVELSNKLIEKYGSPKSESFKWLDETYKNDKEMWNKAFQYDYVMIMTIWDLGNTVLQIRWDHKTGMNVIYCEKGYEANL